ncbi:MAG TPA: hypothetical protein VN903_23380 [Polyangia bacterium]|jgi:hypothetical protein|nr:hypothetical protein [Polyangia bacterium]
MRTLVFMALPLLSSGAVIGCRTARMAAPPDIANASEVLTVSDRSAWHGSFINEGFTLGNYKVVDVDRRLTSTTGIGFGPWAKEKTTAGFSYALAAGGKKLLGKCSSVASSQAVGGFSWGHVKIACTCDGEAGKGELVIIDGARSMKVGDQEYRLEPINAAEGGATLSNPTGFRADGDVPLGAVEVMHPGQVWLKKGLDDATRATTTCTFVGLMLYRPPSDVPH